MNEPSAVSLPHFIVICSLSTINVLTVAFLGFIGPAWIAYGLPFETPRTFIVEASEVAWPLATVLLLSLPLTGFGNMRFWRGIRRESLVELSSYTLVAMLSPVLHGLTFVWTLGWV